MSRPTARESGSPIAIRRRDLMIGIATIAAVGGVSKVLAGPAAAPSPPAAFVDASRFVTGSALADSDAVGRAWSQLTALDAGFAQAVATLATAIRGAGLRDMAAFLASPLARDPGLLATVRTITATWYLGATGAAATATTKDTAGFVTFAGALMYRPTIGLTVIPTYARGGTDYWIDPPAGMPTPPGAARVRDWPTTPSKTSAA